MNWSWFRGKTILACPPKINSVLQVLAYPLHEMYTISYRRRTSASLPATSAPRPSSPRLRLTCVLPCTYVSRDVPMYFDMCRVIRPFLQKYIELAGGRAGGYAHTLIHLHAGMYGYICACVHTYLHTYNKPYYTYEYVYVCFMHICLICIPCTRDVFLAVHPDPFMVRKL